MSTKPMTLPGRYYTDESIFRAEVERFFQQVDLRGAKRASGKAGKLFPARGGGGEHHRHA